MKFDYKELSSETFDNGTRLYEDISGNKVPSVTTILSYCKDESFLDDWRKRIGKQNADDITKESSQVGSFMHKNIENWVNGEEFIKGSNHTRKLGRLLAQKIIDEKLNDLNESWGTEVNLCYNGLYAGTSDLIGIYRNKEAIVDFKNTRKPKKEEYIDDYYKQMVAYSIAHNEMFGTDIKYGIILMASKDEPYIGVLQEFELNGSNYDHYYDLWIRDLEKYYNEKT